MEKHRGMDFLLAKQELIELIKARDIPQALQFATQHLAPFGEKSVSGLRELISVRCLGGLLTGVVRVLATQPQFLHEIEHTMALFAFENQSESPLGHLLGQAQRRRVADEVNSAILRSQKQELGE